MEIGTINRNITHTKNVRSSDSRLLAFDLPTLIDSMKQSYTWANGELNALVLLKSHDKQVILTAMHDGTEIMSYQSNESITFQIIEGKLHFHIRKDTISLNKGQLLTLEEHVKYRLTTDQETVFLLTISTKSTGPAGN